MDFLNTTTQMLHHTCRTTTCRRTCLETSAWTNASRLQPQAAAGCPRCCPLGCWSACWAASVSACAILGGRCPQLRVAACRVRGLPAQQLPRAAPLVAPTATRRCFAPWLADNPDPCISQEGEAYLKRRDVQARSTRSGGHRIRPAPSAARQRRSPAALARLPACLAGRLIARDAPLPPPHPARVLAPLCARMPCMPTAAARCPGSTRAAPRARFSRCGLLLLPFTSSCSGAGWNLPNWGAAGGEQQRPASVPAACRAITCGPVH